MPLWNWLRVDGQVEDRQPSLPAGGGEVGASFSEATAPGSGFSAKLHALRRDDPDRCDTHRRTRLESTWSFVERGGSTAHEVENRLPISE